MLLKLIVHFLNFLKVFFKPFHVSNLRTEISSIVILVLLVVAAVIVADVKEICFTSHRFEKKLNVFNELVFELCF